MTIFLVTFITFVLFVAVMAVGVIFSNRKIKGSCGGLNNVDGLEGECLLCNKKCEKKAVLNEAS
ncbi:MAG: hypothetical protein A6F72_05235 [Cycloclasticus sp. symbiont of Poecilosclerida sp. N]|nr:MAG: hypothetical protein A6F72_05235 [Cycloclasticus sp. symbiont of Poecilosclerida sp. N]